MKTGLFNTEDYPKKYAYNDYGMENPIEISEVEILNTFYFNWCLKMREKGMGDIISKERCIEDWVTIHHAWEIK